MKKFLCDKKGETLVEVMGAILIFTLSSIILYTMITTAVKVNTKVKEIDEVTLTQTVTAEQANATPGTSTEPGTPKGTVTLTASGLPVEVTPENCEVYIFRQDDKDSLYTYRLVSKSK